MQYFVSIENNAYFHWQTELLIESFKLKGLQDSLVIGVADSKPGAAPLSVKNLLNHKNKFKHINYGESKDLPSLNKIYSLVSALKEGMLKQPFTLLHPDMLLFKPIEFDLQHNITYQHDPSSDDKIAKVKFDVQNRFGSTWVGFGNTMIFKDVPLDFFENTLSIMESLQKEHGNHWDVEKAAWLYSLIHYYSNETPLTFHPQQLEMSLLHPDDNANIIHYNHGIPPVFHKKHFKYEHPMFIMTDFDNPYDVFEIHNPTRISDYMKTVIKSYRQ